MGTYADERVARQLPPLMRRINALEAAFFNTATERQSTAFAFDSNGDLHIQTDDSGDPIAKYSTDGIQLAQYSVTGTLIGFGGESPGYVYTKSGTTIRRYTEAGAFDTSFSLGTNDATLVSRASDDYLYVLDESARTLRQYDAGDGSSGATYTFSGTATFSFEGGGTRDNGDIYVVYKANSVATQKLAILDNSLSLVDEFNFNGTGHILADGTTIFAQVSETTYDYTGAAQDTASVTGTIWESRNSDLDDSGNVWCVDSGASQDDIVELDISDMSEISRFTLWETETIPQTTFHRQTGNLGSLLEFQQSLGVPDGGDSIPPDDAFDARGAAGTLTFTGQPSNTQTVTIHNRTYTYKTTLASANDVLIGVDAAATRDNLVAAITNGDGAGTTYHADTAVHATVWATDGASGTSMNVAAIPNTSATDSYASTTTASNQSWGGSTLGAQRPYRAWIVPHTNEVVEMRDSVEDVAPYYINPDTGNPYNWTDSDPDNLYWVANGETEYDWQGPLDMIREGDLNEIDKCIDQLEISDPL